MKKFRRFLAFGLIAALVLAPMTAGAEELVGGGSGSATGESHLEGVLPADIVRVVLPTTTNETYKITLDPNNLLSQYDAAKENYAGKSIYFATAGTPRYTDTSEIATAVNKSTCDILLDVKVKVTNVATNPVTFTAKDEVEAEGNTNTNVYLGLVPTALGSVVGNAEATAAATTPAQAIAVDTTGAASAKFLLTGTASNFTIRQEADPNVTSGHKYSYIAEDDATWTTAGYALEGACNTNANWTEYYKKSQLRENGENLKVNVVYTMRPLTQEQKAQMTGDDAVTPDGTTGLIQLVDSDAEARGFLQTTYEYTPGTELRIPIDLGSGSLRLEPRSVVVSMQGSSGTWYDLSSGTYGGSYSNGIYTIAATSSLSVGDRNIKVVLTLPNNTTKTFSGAVLKVVSP